MRYQNHRNQLIPQEVGQDNEQSYFLRSVLTKLIDALDHELKVKVNASAIEAWNAHLSGTFRGAAGKPAVAQLTHFNRKNSFCGKSKKKGRMSSVLEILSEQDMHLNESVVRPLGEFIVSF